MIFSNDTASQNYYTLEGGGIAFGGDGDDGLVATSYYRFNKADKNITRLAA